MNNFDIFNRLFQLLKNFASLLPVIGLGLLVIISAFVGISVVRRLLAKRYRKKLPFVTLELTPPAFTDKAMMANEQLFVALHNLHFAQSFYEKLLRVTCSYMLTIVSTRAEGIRLQVQVREDQAGIIEKTIHAFLPEVKISQLTNDTIPTQGKFRKRLYFSQSMHYAYPLQPTKLLETHDPLTYITGAMTKLEPGESIAYSLTLEPTVVPDAVRLSGKILSNEDIRPLLQKTKTTVPKYGLYNLNKLLLGVMDFITSLLHGSTRQAQQMAQYDLYYQKQVAMNLRPARSLSVFETELLHVINLKLSQPLFLANIQVRIDANSKARLHERVDSLVAAMGSFSVPKYQSLMVQKKPATAILSTSEVASLYHFPHSQTAKTENIVKSLSKTLPAPVSLKNDSPLAVMLGENRHQGAVTPIGLTEAERERHIYIIGGTGNGKTTMLTYAIVQDIQNGKGVAVLDPHGDLAESLLGYIPKSRIKDVIYLNPDDLTHPIGLNLLELPPGLSGDELLREKDLITESTISVLRKIFSEDDSGGHRIEYVLRNTIQTALTLEEPTLFTIFRLLNDTKYRQSVVRNLEDKDLKIFWQNEIAKAGDMQKVKMSAGITSKVGRFLFSASAKRILEQPKSTINFEELLDTNKILICNFSKGLIGEDTSTLFGTTVLAKLQVAALRRARQKQTERQPFYLYVDEFQNFATMSFVQMLSEARKYKLFLTMAEQSTQQQDQQRLVDIILANVGTVICFRSGSPADERFVLPLFKPYIDEGEIANLPAYQFYMRIAAVEAKEPLSGKTILVGIGFSRFYSVKSLT